MVEEGRDGVEGGNSRDLLGVEGAAIVTRNRVNERRERGKPAREARFGSKADRGVGAREQSGDAHSERDFLNELRLAFELL